MNRAVDLVTLLKTELPGLAPRGARRWSFLLDRDATSGARVEMAPGWLLIRCLLPRREHESCLALLRRTESWPGGVKIVLERSRRLLRAELPDLSQSAAGCQWMTRQLREVMQGLRAALTCAMPERPPEVPGDFGEAETELLAERCRAAGWTAVTRRHEVHVGLESRAVSRVVRIARDAGALRLAVLLEIDDLSCMSAQSLAATEHFLLRAASSLRFARACVWSPAGSPPAVGFESTIAIPTEEDDAPLVLAIDALATACEHFGREVEALQCEELASLYLQSAPCIQSPAPQPVPRPVPLSDGPLWPATPEAIPA